MVIIDLYFVMQTQQVHVYLVDASCFEQGEGQYIQKFGIRVYYHIIMPLPPPPPPCAHVQLNFQQPIQPYTKSIVICMLVKLLLA